MDFLTQVLPLMLGTTSFGTFIGILIEHWLTLQRENRAGKRQLEREERTRAFDVKKDVYQKLNATVYDFSMAIPIAVTEIAKNNIKNEGVENPYRWDIMKHQKELMKAVSQAMLYADENVRDGLTKLDNAAADYITATQEAFIKMQETEKGTIKNQQAIKEYTSAGVRFLTIKNELLEEMRKDLNLDN